MQKMPSVSPIDSHINSKTVSSAGRPPANPPRRKASRAVPNPAPATHSRFSQTLQVRWAEVEFTLRRPIASDADVHYVMAAVEAGHLFLDQLEDKAAELGVLKGQLSRVILPFDHNTSVADQAASVSRAQLPEEYRDRFTPKELQFLVTGAVSLRKLIRVKLADDADLDQARAALDTIGAFFRRLAALAAQRGAGPYATLAETEGLDLPPDISGVASSSEKENTTPLDHDEEDVKKAVAQGNTKLLKKKIQRKSRGVMNT